MRELFVASTPHVFYSVECVSIYFILTALSILPYCIVSTIKSNRHIRAKPLETHADLPRYHVDFLNSGLYSRSSFGCVAYRYGTVGSARFLRLSRDLPPQGFVRHWCRWTQSTRLV